MSELPEPGQGEAGKTVKPQSMLYEVCSICKGTGFNSAINKNCICKLLGVVETGATAAQLEYIAKLDTLRQQAGISAAMLRDGRAAAIVKENEQLRKQVAELEQAVFFFQSQVDEET